MRLKTGINEYIITQPTCGDCFTVGNLWFCRNENKNDDKCYGYGDESCPFHEKYCEQKGIKLDGRITEVK